jgi:uncharacterized protein (TIGR03437 family)
LALSCVAFPLGAIGATGTLSFTAHSLNVGQSDSVSLLALDSSGDAYAVGTVTDSSGRAWIRVTKTNPNGVVTATYQFGGTDTDTPAAVKINAKGEVVIAGSTNSTDFPVTATLVAAIKGWAAFVVKLDAGLTGITASALLGGSKYAPSYQGGFGAGASGLDVDAAGNVYLAGGTEALDFPVTAGAYQTTPPGYDNFGAATYGFLAEITPDLSKIVFATYYGSNAVNCMGSDCIGAWGQTGFSSVAVDGSGAVVASADVYISAQWQTWGSTTVKFAPGGGSVLWSAPIVPEGNGGSQSIRALALDSSGNPVVAGRAHWGEPATTGAASSCADANATGGFVAKLSGSSGAIQFLTYFGCLGQASSAPAVNSVAVDASDAIWITGTAPSSSSLPPAAISSGSGTTYLAQLAADGSSVEALYMAPAGLFGGELVLTPAGNLVLLGSAGILMLSNTAGGPSLLGGVANSAGSVVTGLVAPAEIVSFYGSGLGPAAPLDAQIVNGVVQSTLGGYQLLFGGVAAPLLYIGANQINAIVPNEVYDQDSVSVTLVTPSGSFPLADLYIRPSEPEVFHDPVSGYAVAINQDGTLNSSTNPAHAGWIVSVWGTGSGEAFSSDFPTDGAIIADTSSIFTYPQLAVSVLARYQNPLGVFIGESLEVAYAGISPGEVFGLLQVNFRLPEALPSFAASSGSLYVSLQVGSAAGGWVPIYVAP